MPKKKHDGSRTSPYLSPYVIKQRRMNNRNAVKMISKRKYFPAKSVEIVRDIEILLKFHSDSTVSFLDIKIVPSVCTRYDLYVAQRLLIYPDNNWINGFETSRILHLSWDLAKCDAAGLYFVEQPELLETFSKYYNETFSKLFDESESRHINFHSNCLQELLLWISWLDSPIDFFRGNGWLEDTVSRLLEVLRQRQKDSKVSSCIHTRYENMDKYLKKCVFARV